MLPANKKLKFLGFTVGIFISFTLFGVVQEIIFRGRYGGKDGESGERFTYSVAFTALQCIACSLFAKGLSLTQQQPKSNEHQLYYFFIALFNVIATVTANMSLQWISYPTQNVAKAGRPIPVMLLGALIGRKFYALQKYFFVTVVVLGVAAFMYEDSKQPGDGDNIIKGSYMLAISLLMDGLTGAAQDRLRSVAKPKTVEFMLYVNTWSSLILVSLMSVSGEGRDLIEFARRNPSIIWHLALTIFVGIFGFFFIAAMISNFGSLPACLVTTIRKFFTVLVSVVTFGNALNLRQWVATATIFAALILDATFSKKSEVEIIEPRPETWKCSQALATVPNPLPVVLTLEEKAPQSKEISRSSSSRF